MTQRGDLLAGRFRVEGDPIGHGRAGVVWPALDTETGRAVAVKVLHDALAADPIALRRLQTDAGVAARVEGAHVVRVLGVFADGGRWMLVSERVEGPSLEAVLTQPLAEEVVLAIGADLCRALIAAHRVGVVHGDVRAGNVILGPKGAHLYDFGASSAEERARPGETAPEVEAGAPPSVQADLYGLGVILFRGLSGRAPFAGPTPWAIVGAQRAEAPVPTGPLGLGALIGDLLAPDPSHRPRDAEAVLAALRALRKAPALPARPPRPWLAPLRLGGPWLVHGIDPATGLPALVETDLPRRRALALAKRLRDEGWDVRASREGLGSSDLMWILVAALIGSAVVPVVGAPIAAMLAGWALSSRCEPGLRALPQALAPVPPRRLPAGTEHLVMAGLLLFATAASLQVWPAFAVVPAILCAAVLLVAARLRSRDPVADAARARATTAVEAARRAVAGLGSTDEALALLGELQAIERDWPRGTDDDALIRAEALLVRARGQGADEPVGSARTAEALRRAHLELSPDRPPRS